MRSYDSAHSGYVLELESVLNANLDLTAKLWFEAAGSRG
jgi:hypothetical protein